METALFKLPAHPDIIASGAPDVPAQTSSLSTKAQVIRKLNAVWAARVDLQAGLQRRAEQMC